MMTRMLLLAVLLSLFPRSTRAEDPAPEKKPEPPKKVYAGKVVLLGQALKARGIPHAAEVEDQAVLETPEGSLIPIIADWRGRAFFQDERLRDRKVEIIGQIHEGLPYLQVLMIFTFDEQGQRTYTDYWCDICSIPMYEIKPCDCCQGDIRLRFQPQDLPNFATGEKAE